MRLLPTSKGSIKKRVLREFGGSLVKVPEGYTVAVSELRGWDVILDIDAPGAAPSVFFGAPPATRIGIPFRAESDFFLEVSRRGLVGQAIFDRRKKMAAVDPDAREAAFQEIRTRLSDPDIALGYGEFDYEFSFQTNEERTVRELMADPEIRGLLQGHRSIQFKLLHDDEWLDSLVKSLPDGAAMLYFFQPGTIVKDMERIASIRELLVKTMERLVGMKSASPLPTKLFAQPR